MVLKHETTQLKICLGALRLEYEGHDEFLRSEVPVLLRSMDELQVANLIMPLQLLQTVVDDALSTQEAVDQAVAAVKVEHASLSELDEMEALRLQMAMERVSKTMSTLANLLAKASDTAAAITQNLK